MRVLFLGLIALCGACAGRPAPAVVQSHPAPALPPSSVPGEIGISLSRGHSAGQPVILVKITNRSARQICMRAEVLREDANEMQIRLRDASGREVAIQSGGYLDPPLPGFVRVPPAGAAEGRYSFLRFNLGGPGKPLPEEMTAQSSFRYGYCNDDALSLHATSEWQPI